MLKVVHQDDSLREKSISVNSSFVIDVVKFLMTTQSRESDKSDDLDTSIEKDKHYDNTDVSSQSKALMENAKDDSRSKVEDRSSGQIKEGSDMNKSTLEDSSENNPSKNQNTVLTRRDSKESTSSGEVVIIENPEPCKKSAAPSSSWDIDSSKASYASTSKNPKSSSSSWGKQGTKQSKSSKNKKPSTLHGKRKPESANDFAIDSSRQNKQRKISGHSLSQTTTEVNTCEKKSSSSKSKTDPTQATVSEETKTPHKEVTLESTGLTITIDRNNNDGRLSTPDTARDDQAGIGLKSPESPNNSKDSDSPIQAENVTHVPAKESHDVVLHLSKDREKDLFKEYETSSSEYEDDCDDEDLSFTGENLSPVDTYRKTHDLKYAHLGGTAVKQPQWRTSDDASDYDEIGDFQIGTIDDERFVLNEKAKNLAITGDEFYNLLNNYIENSTKMTVGVGDSKQLMNFNAEINSSNVNYLIGQMLKNILIDNRKSKQRPRVHPLKMPYSYWQPLDYTGARIDVFPGSHRFYKNELKLHKYNRVTIVIPPHCAIIFANHLVHNGSRSRWRGDMNDNVSPDHRLFFYIQKQTQSRTSDTSQLAVHNEFDTHTNLCKLLQENKKCNRCNINDVYGDKVIDITDLYSNGEGYFSKVKVGNVLFGSLKNYGFVIVRAPKPTKSLLSYVHNAELEFSSRSPEIGDKNRKMIYPSTTTDEAKGLNNKKSCLSKFISQIMTKVVHSLLDEEFSPHKVNVLYNSGPIPYSQRPHSDYKNSLPPQKKKQQE